MAKSSPKTKKERLAEVRRRIDRLDKVVHHTPATLTNIHDQRMSSGSYGLDSYMKGGWPCGSLVVITGEPNVGKDMTINLTLIEQQKTLGENLCAAFVYNEGEFDKGFARLQGAKLDWTEQEVTRLEEISGIMVPKKQRAELYNEGIGNLDFYTAGSAEAALTTLIELTKSGIYDFIVLNSIDGMVLEGALSGVDEKGDIAGAAKGRGGQRRAWLLKQFLTLRNMYMADEDEVEGEKPKTVCFMITQWKTKSVGQHHTIDRDMSGGWGVRFFASLILEMTRVRDDETWVGVKNSKDPRHIPTSHLINYHFAKGKHGVVDGGNVQIRYYKRDHKEGALDIPAGSIDETETLRIGMLDAGWIRNRGSRGYEINIPGSEPVEITGGYPMIDHWLRSDSERMSNIRRLLTKEEQKRWRENLGFHAEETEKTEQDSALAEETETKKPARKSRTKDTRKAQRKKPVRSVKLKKALKKPPKKE